MQKDIWESIQFFVVQVIWPFMLEYGIIGAIIVLGGSMALSLLILRFLAKKPGDWSIVRNATRLKIDDALASTATIIKELTLSANIDGLTHYTHRNIFMDGELGDANIEIEDRVGLNEHIVQAHEHIITIKFPNPVKRFAEETTWIKLPLKNSFPAEAESLETKVYHATYEIEMEVEFPPDRLPVEGSICVVLRPGGKPVVLARPKIINRTVRWSMRRKRIRLPIRSSRLEAMLFGIPNGDYELKWRW